MSEWEASLTDVVKKRGDAEKAAKAAQVEFESSVAAVVAGGVPQIEVADYLNLTKGRVSQIVVRHRTGCARAAFMGVEPGGQLAANVLLEGDQPQVTLDTERLAIPLNSGSHRESNEKVSRRTL